MPSSSGGRSQKGALRRSLSAVGVVSACLLICGINVLASRFFWRADVTSTGLYSLSEPTLQTLRRLDDSVEIVVFLPNADPLTSSVRYLVDAYRERTPWLSARFVDPDRDPATFVALQREYGVFEGRTENGRLATEASIAIVRGDRRWFITTDDIVAYDDDGLARPRLEQALTEGLVNVLGTAKTTVCFSQGHGELGLEDGGPDGLRELRARLERNNYTVLAVNPSLLDASARLLPCAVLVIAGPQESFDKHAGGALLSYWEQGGSVFIAAGAELGDTRRNELGVFLGKLGITPQNDLTFETDADRSLPIGLGGEVFIASTVPHAVTRGLDSLHGGGVVLRLSQSFVLEPQGVGQPLLVSSGAAFSLPSLDGLESSDAPEILRRAAESTHRHVLAAAVEIPRPAKSAADESGLSRLLVVGTASPLWGTTWHEPGLLSTRRFVENGLSWLAHRAQLVSVPEKPGHAVGLALTEGALAEVQRYVLIYMPLSAALVGLLLLLRRRHESPREQEL